MRPSCHIDLSTVPIALLIAFLTHGVRVYLNKYLKSIPLGKITSLFFEFGATVVKTLVNKGVLRVVSLLTHHTKNTLMQLAM